MQQTTCCFPQQTELYTCQIRGMQQARQRAAVRHVTQNCKRPSAAARWHEQFPSVFRWPVTDPRLVSLSSARDGARGELSLQRSPKPFPRFQEIKFEHPKPCLVQLPARHPSFRTSLLASWRFRLPLLICLLYFTPDTDWEIERVKERERDREKEREIQR